MKNTQEIERRLITYLIEQENLSYSDVHTVLKKAAQRAAILGKTLERSGLSDWQGITPREAMLKGVSESIRDSFADRLPSEG